MAKRSDGDFERIPKDLYRTWDKRALPPLLPYLPAGASYVEPCAGHGDLIEQLQAAGMECRGAYDLTPRKLDIAGCEIRHIGKRDAVKFKAEDHFYDFDLYISNPPWRRDLLHAIMLNLYWQKPTWMLFDADWIHTEQSRPYRFLVRKIVSVGRLRWIPDSKYDGKDNCAWYLLGPPPGATTEFVGRI